MHFTTVGTGYSTERGREKVEFAKAERLNVKFNDELSRDFTNPRLPPRDASPQSAAASTLVPGVGAMRVGVPRRGRSAIPHRHPLPP